MRLRHALVAPLVGLVALTGVATTATIVVEESLVGVGAAAITLWGAPDQIIKVPVVYAEALIFVACGMFWNGLRHLRNLECAQGPPDRIEVDGNGRVRIRRHEVEQIDTAALLELAPWAGRQVLHIGMRRIELAFLKIRTE